MEKIWEKSDSIHAAFKQMDTDRSGSLSANELKAVLDSYCYKIPDEMFADLLGLFDADGDGEISFHEFMTCVKRSVGNSGYNQPLVETVQPEKSIFGNEDGKAYMQRANANVAANAKHKTVMTLLKKLLVAKPSAYSKFQSHPFNQGWLFLWLDPSNPRQTA